jgi:gamma-glutamylcyclotransferase (GGCT)/AIG2-like uncharacterized protein YtfP
MKQLSSDQLFVYSSLRYGFQEGVFQYISKFFTLVGHAKAKGILKDVEGLPVATYAEGDSFIAGDLYTLNNQDDFTWAFEQLDDYEGIITETGQKPLYRRELTKVFKNDGSNSVAWIYWYNRDVSTKAEIPFESIMIDDKVSLQT